MSVHKVACPNCNSVLKSAKPMRPGVQITCPACKSGFRVPTDVSVAVGVGAPPAARGAIASGSPPATLGVPAPAGAAPAKLTAGAWSDVASAPSIELPPINHFGRRLALTLGGAAGVLLLSITVVVACFWNSAAPTIDRESQDPFELPEPVVKKAAPKPLIELSKEDQATVDAMVKKGVDYLKRTQNAEGTWGANAQWDNYVCFGGLTLLECGVPPSDPHVQKAARHARSRMASINRTYPASLFLLFFDRLHEASKKANWKDPDSARDLDHIRDLAMRLVCGQTSSGGWTYEIPILGTSDVERTRALLEDMQRGGRVGNALRSRAEVRRSIEDVRRKSVATIQDLPLAVRRAGVLSAPAPEAHANVFRQGGDNSNTQFALLALWAARRHNLPVDPALDLVVRRFQNTQNADGSFNYSGHTNVTHLPTMTCAGLLGLAVGYGLAEIREGPGAQKDPAIEKGLAHLSKSIGAAKGKAKGKLQLTATYYLWSIERVAVLFQLKKIGDHEWYPLGLHMLRDTQRPDGAWRSPATIGHGDEFIDTCFCLLFLQRVNLAKDLTDKLEEIGAAAGPVVGAAPPGTPRKEP